jgi:hypothetical protein
MLGRPPEQLIVATVLPAQFPVPHARPFSCSLADQAADGVPGH